MRESSLLEERRSSPHDTETQETSFGEKEHLQKFYAVHVGIMMMEKTMRHHHLTEFRAQLQLL